ncbi:hypothetical protein SD074_17020 [Prolixibacter sp. SD074]|nr:hypothetical protein SD074_17020 [Prolixibacter sp. SD074]
MKPDRWDKVPAPVEDWESVPLQKGKAPTKTMKSNSDVDWAEDVEQAEEEAPDVEQAAEEEAAFRCSWL